MKTKTFEIVLCAIFVAIISVFSQIIIPISVVPVSLSSFAVMICGGVLGIKLGVVTTILYLLIGAVGIPVFSGFQGGVSVLLGPNGGFIFGYIVIAMLSGIAFGNKDGVLFKTILLFLSTTACCTLGALWYMFITGAGFVTAILTCILPFLPGEIVKIAVAYPVIVRIKKQI